MWWCSLRRGEGGLDWIGLDWIGWVGMGWRRVEWDGKGVRSAIKEVGEAMEL